MRRTSTLRLLVIDNSELAKNMYGLLFQDLPGYRVEFAEKLEGLEERKRRARPHVVLLNSNAVSREDSEVKAMAFLADYPTVIVSALDRLDLKDLARQHDNVELIHKPFYPYDLITVINRVASTHHPLSGSTEPAPAPKRRRMRKKGSA